MLKFLDPHTHFQPLFRTFELTLAYRFPPTAIALRQGEGLVDGEGNGAVAACRLAALRRGQRLTTSSQMHRTDYKWNKQFLFKVRSRS